MNIAVSFIHHGRLYFVTELGKIYWINTDTTEELDWFFQLLTEIPR